MRDFGGKVAVVTGAASGVGRAMAERFAQEGMRVVLADIERAALDRAVDELRHYDVVGVRTDVARLESVQDLAREAVSTFGKVHVVCNNAGVEGYSLPDKPIWEARERDWMWNFGVNFWGVVHGARTFMPIMLAQDEEAHMVNTAGITKHGVIALTETISAQLAQREARVAVSVVYPGRRSALPPPADIADMVLHAIRDRQLYVPTDRSDSR